MNARRLLRGATRQDGKGNPGHSGATSGEEVLSIDRRSEKAHNGANFVPLENLLKLRQILPHDANSVEAVPETGLTSIGLDAGRTADASLRLTRGEWHWQKSQVWSVRQAYIINHGYWAMIVVGLAGSAIFGPMVGIIASTIGVFATAEVAIRAMAWMQNYHEGMSLFYGYKPEKDKKAPD